MVAPPRRSSNTTTTNTTTTSTSSTREVTGRRGSTKKPTTTTEPSTGATPTGYRGRRSSSKNDTTTNATGLSTASHPPPKARRASKVAERLGEALEAGLEGDRSLSAAVAEGVVWRSTGTAVPIMQIPNGEVLSTTDADVFCVQAGRIVVDPFQVRWLPIYLEDGAVAFTPISLKTFGETQEAHLCWEHVKAQPPEADGDDEGIATGIVPPKVVPFPRIALSISPLPSQGFLHGFQLDGAIQGYGLHINRRQTAPRDAFPEEYEDFCARVGEGGGDLRSFIDTYRHFFWGSHDGVVHPPFSAWNAVWQSLMGARLGASRAELWGALADHILTQFNTVCTEICSAITLESAPTSERSRKRTVFPLGGIAGDFAYIVNGVLVEQASENAAQGSVFKTFTAAAKYQSLQLKHTNLLYTFRTPMLSAPLCCTVAFAGQRFLCTALIPVSISSLLLGSTDGGKKYAGETRAGPLPAPYLTALRRVGSEIGIHGKEGGDPERDWGLNRDSQVLAGGDGRVYVTNVARLLPQTLPSDSGEQDWRNLMKSCVRPEALASFAGAVDPDCFTSFLDETQSLKKNLQCARLTHFIRTQLIERVADCFSTLTLPNGFASRPARGEAPHPKVIFCVSCHEKVDSQNRFRFHACTNMKEQCCWVCAGCYVSRWENEDGAATPNITTKCGLAAQPLTGMPMHPSVSAVCHYYGVNMKHVGVVYSGLRHYRPAVQHYLQVEMAARGFKAWRAVQIKKEATLTLEQQCRQNALYMKKLLFLSQHAQEYWRADLMPFVVAKFKLHMPFSLSAVERGLLYLRALSLCGLKAPTKSDGLASVREETLPNAIPFTPLVKGLHLDQMVAFPNYDHSVLFKGAPEGSVKSFWEAQLRTSGYAEVVTVAPQVQCVLDGGVTV